MSPLLLRAGLRHHLRHPWQLALALIGVALGVTVVVAVDMAIASAGRAFRLSTEAVTGRATHEVLGGPAGLPESMYVSLRVDAGLNRVAPVLDRIVKAPDHGDAVLRLLGVDPFAEAPFRSWISGSTSGLDAGMLIARRALLLEAGTAARLGVTAGDSIAIAAGTRLTTAVVGGILDMDDPLARRALADVALADIATAQEIAGAVGVLDRIEIMVAEGPDGDDLLATLRAQLPAGARVVETAARTGATARMTRAFDTNLTALALVALVFGMFLIYNSVTFSLVQRRPLIALLRAQGVTAREVATMVLAEAAVAGVVATALGVVAGALLGSGLVALVARTINDLYFTVTVTPRLGAATVMKGAALGIGATVLAALPPVREAVATRPRYALARSSLERGLRRRAARLATAGAVAAAAGAVVLLIPARSITLGFAALFVLILAAALLTPAATILFMAAVRPVAGMLGPVPRMAARGVSSSLSRTAPAIAALSVAIAVGIAVTIMIASFRAGVITWLDRSLPADIYVAAPDLGADRTENALDPALPPAVRRMSGIAGVSTYRHASILLDDDVVRLIAADLHPTHLDAFEVLDGGAGATARFGEGGLLVSEPLAWRRGLAAGDTLRLPTDRGPVRFTIAGIFRDYASEHGVIFIDRRHYDHLWDDDAVTSIGVFVAGGVSAESIEAAIRALPAAAGTVVRSNRGLRESTLVVFDRTFAITRVLRLLALLVAFVGVGSALMALQLERAREIGVLRTTGLTPAQVWSLVTTQTGLMGLTAALLAAPLGLAMAWAMVHVVNRRSFGWSFDMLVDGTPFVQALVVGVGAALLAGVYPAWRMARIRPAIAVREE
ncbi:MAG TPA: FtsX-like permease family protein [Longimicrobiales bacterium]|nr:FtsX-like permease family protein [Longimicrobiales bacterium]